jgi:hypothetical protein
LGKGSKLQNRFSHGLRISFLQEAVGKYFLPIHFLFSFPNGCPAHILDFIEDGKVCLVDYHYLYFKLGFVKVQLSYKFKLLRACLDWLI